MGTSVAPVAPAVVDAAPAAPASIPQAPTPVVPPAPTPGIRGDIRPQPTKGDVLKSLGAPRAESVPTDTVPAPTADATPAVTDAIPEAEAAPESEAPPKPDVPEPVGDGLKYRKRNANGEYIAPDASAKVEFEINGKKYLKSEAELVRGFARSVDASRFQQEAQTLREREIPAITQRYEQQVTQVRSEFQEQAAVNIEILEAARRAIRDGDSSKLESVVAEWEQLNSPETQLQRTQAELDAIRRQTETESRTQEAVQLVTDLQNVVSPIFTNLTTTHADAFGGAEVLQALLRGRLVEYRTSLTGPPDQRAHAVAEFVKGPLSQWVEATATKLRGNQTAATEAAKAAEQEAQRARQAQRQAESRGLVPVGQTPSTSSTAPRTAPLTKQQALEKLAGRSG